VKHGFAIDEVEAVEAKVHPLVLELTGKKTPQAGLEGKFSVYHSAAAALIHGAAGEAEYSDACVRDPQVVALRDRVSAEIDRGLHEDQARVTIRLKGGRSVDTFVEHAIGSVDRPMSDVDLESKFRGLASAVLGKPQIDRLIALCWNIGKMGNVADLARATVPK
jgi:2-methylcitrate dehydratase PrpD